MKKRVNYYENFNIWGYNAIFNFILTIRSRGKTFSFLSRALGRAKKHGEKTLIVRRYKAEADEAKAKLVNADFIKKYGLNEKNYKQDGNKWYIKRGNAWHCWLEITYLARVKAWRGARESNIFTVVFDEFTTTPEKYRFYRGNEAEDFLDIVSSVRGNHDIRVFFLGNKESVTNPYFTYFNIPVPEDGFEGIRRIKKEIAVECWNTKAEAQKTRANDRYESALNGTRYGDYLTKGVYKRGALKIDKMPASARLWLQFDFIAPVSVFKTNNEYFIKSNVNADLPVFTQTQSHYKKGIILRQTDKKIFETLGDAYKFGRVKYVDEKANEAFISVAKFLSFK